MLVSTAFALTVHLNACRHSAISAEVVARSVRGEHAAHHVIDTEGLLGLDPLAANELDTAIGAAMLLVDSDWALALPRPGRLGPLTGPPTLTSLALDAGAVVLPLAGGPAWVPVAVGPAIQWRLLHANPPRMVNTAVDADRRLKETILTAHRQLGTLARAATSRPAEEHPLLFPGGYPGRAQQLADRAWLLLQAMDAALNDERGELHVQAIETRRRTLTEVRDAAEEALCAAAAWPDRTT
jgi:hypothetical protein